MKNKKVFILAKQQAT